MVTLTIAITVFIIILNYVGWKILNWLWLTPMKKEMILRQQGFRGNSYNFRRLLFGDAEENAKVYEEALSRSINVRDETQAAHRILPFVHKTIEKYGK